MISERLELFHFLSFLSRKNTGERMGLPWWSSGYDPILPIQGAWVRSLGWEDPLEKGVATHSSILAWRIS